MTVYVGFEIELEKKPSTHGSRNNVMTKLSKETKDITGLTDHTVRSYHSAHKSSNIWRLESDSSLRGGAEFISPPILVDEALDLLFRFLSHVDKNGCTTTSRCSLHVNMSSINKTLTDININSFITRIDTRVLFKYWGERLNSNNVYIRNMSHIIDNQKGSLLRFNCNEKKQLKKRLDCISSNFLHSRYNFINLRTYNGVSYFEIRAIGGKDYHKRFDAIKNTVKYFEKLIIEARNDLPVVKSVTSISNVPNKDKKHYKSIISYINRAKNKTKSDKEIFIPCISECDVSLRQLILDNVALIRNIHQYTAKELTKKLFGYPSLVILLGPPIKTYTVNAIDKFKSTEHAVILRRYAKRCIRFIEREAYTLNISRQKSICNYITYHICKFMYNSLSKKTCMNYMRNNIDLIKFEKFIPKDESLREALWVFDCLRNMDKHYRVAFIKGLPPNVIDFLLRHRKKGMFLLAKDRKKQLMQIKEARQQ